MTEGAALVALYVASALAVATGAALAYRDRKHLPVVAMLAYGLASDIAQRILGPWSPPPHHPLHGWPRVAFHVGEALYTAYAFAVAAVCLRTLAQRPYRWLVPVWAAYVAGLIVAYPHGAWDGPLAKVYAIAQAGLVAVMAGAAVPLVSRLRRAGSPSATEMVTVAAAAAEASLLLGPLLVDPAGRWRYARVSYGAFYLFTIFVQTKELSRWARQSR